MVSKASPQRGGGRKASYCLTCPYVVYIYVPYAHPRYCMEDFSDSKEVAILVIMMKNVMAGSKSK